jgi:anti-sigma B factor antagonist
LERHTLHVLLTEHHGRPTVIALRGELDLATPGDELLARLPTLTSATGARFALDLSGVTFLDCSGLRALLTLEQRIRRDGGELCVSAASPEATRVLDLLADYLDPCSLITRRAQDRTAATVAN